MSAPGTPMDPVQALARQPVAPPPAAPQALPPDDPVALLAAGKLQTAPQGPEPAAAQNAPAQHSLDWKGPEWANPSGSLSATVRNFVNGMTMNIADPVAAATGALFPVKGWTSTKPTYAERYHELLDISRGATAQGQKSHPIESLGASVAGGFFNPVAQGMGVPSSLLEGIGQGAALGGLYSLGGNIGSGKTATDIGKEAALGAAGGGVAGAAGYGIGKLLTGGTRSADAQVLHDEGVPLTIGQSSGGTAQNVEDSLTHIPALGNAIKGQQRNALLEANRAAYNRVLEPLGIKYSSSGPIGNEGVGKLSDLMDDAYAKAFDGAVVTKTPELEQQLQQAVANATDVLPDTRVNQIQANIQSKILDKFGDSGTLTGDALKHAKEWFAGQARGGPTQSTDDRNLSAAYKSVLSALKYGMDDDHANLLNAADSAYSRFLKVQQAATTDTKAGVFTGAQLARALRSLDTSAHRGSFARGEVPMQDLAQAMQHVLPSTVPDSGTALRGLMELGLGGMAVHGVAPETAMAAAAPIGAGMAFYTSPGQKLGNALIYGAPAARKAMGELPWYAVPGALAALSASSAGSKP